VDLGLLLFIIVVLLLLGALPVYPYSRAWGYGPSGLLGLLLIILIVLMLVGTIHPFWGPYYGPPAPPP
jgi:hypothetical protein